jgi:hypothetical protein
MSTGILRSLSCASLASAVLLLGACSPPPTDIVATTTEDTGAWDVTDARVNGDTLTATVCMGRPGSAAVISDHLLEQLRSKNYKRIELSMFGQGEQHGAAAQRVSWTPTQRKQMQPMGDASANPCDTGRQRSPAEGQPKAEAPSQAR